MSMYERIVGDNDLEIWIKKIGVHATFIFIAGLAALYGESQWYLVLAPALEGLRNWLKHR